MLLVVDDDEDLREMFGRLFASAHIPHVCAGSLAEVTALGDVLTRLETALLDINLGAGQPSGIDVARWLTDHGYAARIIFITGHAPEHPLVSAAGSSARVLEKPIAPKELLKIVRSA
jgi:DNA-binding response OmpR family regulator